MGAGQSANDHVRGRSGVRCHWQRDQDGWHRSLIAIAKVLLPMLSVWLLLCCSRLLTLRSRVLVVPLRFWAMSLRQWQVSSSDVVERSGRMRSRVSTTPLLASGTVLRSLSRRLIFPSVGTVGGFSYRST